MLLRERREIILSDGFGGWCDMKFTVLGDMIEAFFDAFLRSISRCAGTILPAGKGRK